MPLPSMISTQVLFPMFYHEGILYAAGGRSSGSDPVPNMRFLNLESSSWINGAANNPSGFYAHCGILYKDRIYTFGGSRYDFDHFKLFQFFHFRLKTSFTLFANRSFYFPQTKVIIRFDIDND